MKATLRPWAIRLESEIFCPANDGCVASVLSGGVLASQVGLVEKRAVRIANAELIVRAVNNHDELLTALEEMCKYWDWSIGDPDFEAYRRAKQAIKKAKS